MGSIALDFADTFVCEPFEKVGRFVDSVALRVKFFGVVPYQLDVGNQVIFVGVESSIDSTFDCAQIHGMFNDLVINGEDAKGMGVDRLSKRQGTRMPKYIIKYKSGSYMTVC